MRRNTRWAALGAGLLLTTGLTACGDGGTNAADDPKTALSEAVEALADYDGVELTLSLDGDRDAIVEAADGDLEPDDADLLLQSSLVFRAAGEDETDGRAEFLVNLGDQQVVEMRVLPEQRFFFRVDLDAVAGAIDDPNFTSDIDEMVGMADAFGLGELATAVRAGEWVELTGVEQMTELAGGGTTEEPSEEEVEDVREQMVASLQQFLDEEVEATYVGEESAGERITASTTEGDIATLMQEIAQIAGDLGGVDPEAFGGDVAGDEGSDTPVQLDFWIDGGRLSQIGFDLSQIEGEDAAPEGTFLLAGIAEFTGSVDAPDDATEIDLFAIMGSMMSGGLGEMDPSLEDGGEDLGGEDLDEIDPLGGQCMTQEQLDEMTGGDPEVQAEIDQAIEMGFLELC